MKANVKRLSLILCIVLAAALALTGCGAQEAPAAETTVYESGATIGEGDTAFTFTVTDGEGEEASFTVNTDDETVGQALLDAGILAGEDGPYGLYVKTVNGITADYDVDGTYWAFYVDGEYAMTGVDTIDVTPGTTYSFKVEK